MYTIYNAYGFRGQGHTREFDTYESMVNWLSQYNIHSIDREHNDFLDKTGVNESDVYTPIPRFKFYTIFPDYFPRLNRIYDADGNNAYCKQLIKDVLRHTYDKDADIKDLMKNKKSNQTLIGYRYIDNKDIPDFRRGPIPYTGGRRNYNVYRFPKHMNTRRQAVDPDFDGGVRKKYIDNLPDGWIEERVRDWRNTGWKRQGRNRKQWEVNVKTKTKHELKAVYVCKPTDKRQLDSINIDVLDDIQDLEDCA